MYCLDQGLHGPMTGSREQFFTEMNDIGANIYGYSMGSAVRGRLLKEFMDISRPDNVDLLLDLVRNEFTLTNAITKEKSADGNLQQMILPSLERIKHNKGEDVYIEEHRKVLNNLTPSLGQSINSIRSKLTPREMEVCNMVRNGMVTKDIARLLHIASHTVEKHRRMSRKKLGLTNNGVNLFSYLNSF